MTSFVWNGLEGAYSNPANWAPMGVPGPADIAVIASGGAETAGMTLLHVEIQLGSTGVDGTLAATAPSDTSNAGGLDEGSFITTAAVAGAEGNLNIAGEFDIGEAALYVGGEGSRLTITLAPAANGTPGLLLAEPSLFPSIVGYASSTLLITPLTANLANQVALENDGEAATGGGTLVDEVPTYAKNGLGFFDVGGGTLRFESSVSDQLVSLDMPSAGAPPPTLVIDQPSAFQATIGSDVAPGDEFGPLGLPIGTAIDLRDLSAASLAFSQDGQAGSQAIELVNGTTAVATLNLVAGNGAFGVSLAPDGTGGTLLRVDVSSNSSALGGAAIDPAAVQIAGARAQFSFSVGSNGTTLAGQGFTDLVTPGASLQFIDGEEFVSPSSQGGTLYRFYETALGRAPDAAGLTYWNNVFNEGIGATAIDIAAGILSSPEYRSDAFGLSNTRFVDRLYIDGLGRTPDASGDAFWNSLLVGGTSQAQVLAGFVSAPEAVQHSAAAFSGGLFVPTPT